MKLDMHWRRINLPLTANGALQRLMKLDLSTEDLPNLTPAQGQKYSAAIAEPGQHSRPLN